MVAQGSNAKRYYLKARQLVAILKPLVKQILRFLLYR